MNDRYKKSEKFVNDLATYGLLYLAAGIIFAFGSAGVTGNARTLELIVGGSAFTVGLGAMIYSVVHNNLVTEKLRWQQQ